MLNYLPAISAKENPDTIAMAAEIANWTKKFENLRKTESSFLPLVSKILEIERICVQVDLRLVIITHCP